MRRYKEIPLFTRRLRGRRPRGNINSPQRRAEREIRRTSYLNLRDVLTAGSPRYELENRSRNYYHRDSSYECTADPSGRRRRDRWEDERIKVSLNANAQKKNCQQIAILW
jgi:hypothetical protein